MEYKICIRCKKEKKLSEYGINKRNFIRHGVALNSYCKECVCEQSKINRDKDPDKRREIKKKSRHKNPESTRESSRKQRAKKPEAYCLLARNFYAKNKEKIKSQSAISKQNRRARKLYSGGTLSKDIFQKLMVLQKGRCAICHKDLNKLEKRKVHLDHIMPLALGGANEDYNIQLLCQTCNSKKSAKDPITYMQSLGKLL